jgi:hypothetical protein
MVLNGNGSEKQAFSDGFSGFVTTSSLDNALRRLADHPSGTDAAESD